MLAGDRDSTHIIEQLIPLLETVVTRTARRKRLGTAEREELLSDVWLKCLRRDCHVLRRFAGRSCLETYLTTVVDRVLLDRRVKDWGRWRSSAAARRLGDTAIRLEELLWRERHSLAEAIEILRANFGAAESSAELREIASRLPARTGRRCRPLGPSEQVRGELRSDERLTAGERRSRARKVEQALSAALETLPSDDLEIVRLRFARGLPVAQIARQLGLKQRSLYSRMAKILRRLKRQLESRGLSAHDARELCGWSGLHLQVGL